MQATTTAARAKVRPVRLPGWAPEARTLTRALLARRRRLADKLATKSRRQVIKLPWEVATYYSNFLAGHASKRRRMATAASHHLDDDDAEDEDEDELEANEDLLARLRVRPPSCARSCRRPDRSTLTCLPSLASQDADLLTRDMTREEYAHYSECRQASFTFKKGKRFREFINFSAYLDAKPNDEIIVRFPPLCFPPCRAPADSPFARPPVPSRTSLASSATRWSTH